MPPIFAGDGVEADPWFTSDGRHLYFISTRSTDGVRREDLDIWHVERTADGRWGTPTRLPEPVNSTGRKWFPRLAVDGWLYFGSDRPGGLGKTDIWRARTDSQDRWTVRNLGPSINSAGHEYEPLISPDGSSMIVMAEGGLYEARRNGAEWTARVKLPPEINVNGSEIGAVYSPSGASLLFSRDTGSPLSGGVFPVAHPRRRDLALGVSGPRRGRMKVGLPSLAAAVAAHVTNRHRRSSPTSCSGRTAQCRCGRRLVLRRPARAGSVAGTTLSHRSASSPHEGPAAARRPHNVSLGQVDDLLSGPGGIRDRDPAVTSGQRQQPGGWIPGGAHGRRNLPAASPVAQERGASFSQRARDGASAAPTGPPAARATAVQATRFQVQRARPAWSPSGRTRPAAVSAATDAQPDKS